MPDFLELPPELRNEIYGYMVSGRNGKPQQYEGMYTSCKQVKKEMDAEAIRGFDAIRQKILPTTFTFDRDLFLPSSVTIFMNVPISTIVHMPQQCASVLDQFQPLLQLFEYRWKQVDICFALPELGPRAWWSPAHCFLSRLDDVPGLETPIRCFTVFQTPQIDHNVLGVMIEYIHYRTDPSEGPRGLTRRGLDRPSAL